MDTREVNLKWKLKSLPKALAPMCTIIMEFVGDKKESEEDRNKRMLEKRWKRKEKRERVEQIEQQRRLYEAEEKV